MELRPELLPPRLDEAKVARLARLAEVIDGANPGQWEVELAEFNRLAGTNLAFLDFQGTYGGEEHETWVRRVLTYQAARPVPGITRPELVELVRRIMSEEHPVNEAYMAIFDANVPMPSASNLVFYPPDYDAGTNTWGGGRNMGEYSPTPDQVVDWALANVQRKEQLTAES